MEYTQERVATLHDYGAADPDAPVERAAVVVPMTDREYAGLAAEGVLSTLERLAPERVYVPLRAPADRVRPFVEWLDGFDLPLEVLWCSGPRVAELLASVDLDGEAGKGRDVWLALGLAARSSYVVLHDADARSYTARDVSKLLAPLAEDFSFVKGYYARVESGRLYGRLFRLFYAPLVAALADRIDADVLDYLGAFRYALAGECAMTAGVARSMRVQRRWGLEVGTLGEAYRLAGARDSAQVDLGVYEHDHRSVSGSMGLGEMSDGVAEAVFRTVEGDGVTPAYDTLPTRYVATAQRFIRGYAADARFNGFAHDETAEREQVATYREAIAPPGPDTRLPAWEDAPLDAANVREAAARDLDAVR